jgi:hypothetical protein
MRNRIRMARPAAADDGTATAAADDGTATAAADDGTATAEYAIVTMAAVTIAGVLLKVVAGDEVEGIITGLIRRALSVG